MSERSSRTVDFHITQATDFKTSFATGSYASLTPNGLVNVNFYVDRQPLPDLVTYSLENNKLGSEQSRSIRKGVVRELQQGIILDVDSVKGLISGLQQILRLHEENTQAENQ